MHCFHHPKVVTTRFVILASCSIMHHKKNCQTCKNAQQVYETGDTVLMVTLSVTSYAFQKMILLPIFHPGHLWAHSETSAGTRVKARNSKPRIKFVLPAILAFSDQIRSLVGHTGPKVRPKEKNSMRKREGVLVWSLP